MSEAGPAAPCRRVGVLMLDTRFHRFVGDAGHPQSWPGEALIERVAGADVARVVRQGDDGLVPLFAEAGQRLLDRGATILTTTCGFLSIHQQALASRLAAPLVSSALFYPALSERLGEARRRFGILTYDARSLSPRHLAAAGLPIDTPISGFSPGSAFHDWIEGGGAPDFDHLTQAMVDLAVALVSERPDIEALLFECANMPPFAAAVESAVRRPVRHILQAVAETPDRFGNGPASQPRGARDQ